MKDEKTQTKSSRWSIVGLVALILVLFVGVKLVFLGLEAAIPQEKHAAASSSQSQDAGAGQSSSSQESGSPAAPSYCPYCGRELNGSFQWGQYCPFCGEKVEQ